MISPVVYVEVSNVPLPMFFFAAVVSPGGRTELELLKGIIICMTLLCFYVEHCLIQL